MLTLEVFSIPVLLRLIVILAALTGIFVAQHIRHKKKTGPFVCPLKFDCHTVVNSDYSKILGIPVEIIGIGYYVIIAVSYGLFVLLPDYATNEYTLGVLIVTVLAFLFSMYLTGVQAFKLRQWCSLCLFSACMCTIIFASVLTLALVY